MTSPCLQIELARKGWWWWRNAFDGSKRAAQEGMKDDPDKPNQGLSRREGEGNRNDEVRGELRHDSRAKKKTEQKTLKG